MNVKDAILERFAALPPKMQEAARFIIDHPDEVVVSSMRGIAERSGVQPATFVRLARQLGYSGWPGLKAAFAADMGLQTAQYGQRAKDLASRGTDSRLLGGARLGGPTASLRDAGGTAGAAGRSRATMGCAAVRTVSLVVRPWSQ